ncbi:MAG: RagB/SusD family nutrient uptake outer membrane protein [Rikenellaceae bacterium]
MKNILFILVLFATVLVSCNKDFLETKSTQSVDEATIFGTTSDALMAINGIHRLMYEASSTTGTSTSYYGQGGYQTFILNLAMMSDDVVYTRNNPVFQTAATWLMHRSISDKDLTYNYRFFYRIIGNTNKVLQNIDNVTGPKQERDYIKGQALVYRAFSHFNLVQCFGERYKPGGENTQLGIIIKTDNNLDPLPRSTLEQVYKLINDDMDEAITLLKDVTIKRTNKSHIDIHVARTIKARVMLVQGRWAEAASFAREVINLSGAELQADTYTTINQRMSDQTNTEWIWGKYAVQDQAGTLRDWHSFISNMNVSYNRNTPRAIYNLLYEKISSTDVRKTLWFPRAQDKNYTPQPIIPPNGNKRNFMSNKWLLTNNTDKCADFAYIRLPELMLIEAEALARQGKWSEAASALYPLAKSRDPQYTLSVKTGDALIDEIMIQRRIELWAEGFRWFDLKRQNIPLDRGPKPRDGYNQGGWNNSTVMPANVDPLASNYNMYDEQGMGEANRYRAAGDKEWQWLFPEAEVSSNKFLIQNPL